MRQCAAASDRINVLYNILAHGAILFVLSCSGLWAQHLAAPVVFRLVFSLLRAFSAPCVLLAARTLRLAGHLAEGTQALQTGQDDSPIAELS